MVGRDNVTFSFRIDSAKAQAALRQLEAVVKKVGGTAVTSSVGLDKLKGSLDSTGNRAAASAVNFQTATQGMLNLSTAAVQTFTSISNLDRANNRAKMSIIAVARAEDLLNNKRQRLKEMTEAGTTAGGKYANMQREIATAEADLTVKIEKKGIEQAAVNDIYMLFATNIANVTISSMQTLAILDKNQIMLTKAKAAALKISNFFHMDQVRISAATTKAKFIEANAQNIATGAITKQTIAVKGLTASVRAFMASNPVTLGLMVASTAAFALHESNILGTKDALDELMGVEKDFESQVKEGRDGIEEYDETLGKLNSTVGSSLPNSFESATKVMIAYTNSIRENISVVEQDAVAIEKLHGIIASGRDRKGGSASNIQPPPQVTQTAPTSNRRFATNFSSPSVAGGQNEALANALSATGAFLMADPFAGSYAHADRGDNRDRELIAIEEKAQVESRRGKISIPSAIAAAAQPTPESFQGDQGSIFKEGADMNNQFTLHGHSGGISNIPAIQDLAKDLGVSVESLEGSLSTGEFSIKQLQIANQILSGDLMTIKHLKDFTASTKFKQFTPELESDRLALEKAKEQDKNFAEIFRERYMGTGVSIDKILNELGKLEPDRKRRLDTKNMTFVDGIGFDLTKESGLKAHQKYMQAKLGQLIPTVDPLHFADIKDKQKELTANQYLRFLGGKGLQDMSSFTDNQNQNYRFGQIRELDGNIMKLNNSTSNVILNKNQNRLLSKIQNGEISGNRAEVLLELGIDIGNAANNYSLEDAMRIGALQTQAAGFQGLGGRGAEAIRSVGGNATQAYQVGRNKDGSSKLNWAGKKDWKTDLARGDSFVNGLGGMIMNVVNQLKGGRMVYSSGHRSVTRDRRWNGIDGSDIISEAVRMGIKELPEWMDRINAIPTVDKQSENNMSQAWGALGAARGIASEFVSMVNSSMSQIGFTSTIKSRANLAGFSGAGLYQNIALLAATKRTNFNNTEIPEQSQSKLNLTNSQTFAIRFNATRGDTELQDRFRYVDQLEAMSSGTSPL